MPGTRPGIEWTQREDDASRLLSAMAKRQLSAGRGRFFSRQMRIIGVPRATTNNRAAKRFDLSTKIPTPLTCLE
jgi:hypothetical protein